MQVVGSCLLSGFCWLLSCFRPPCHFEVAGSFHMWPTDSQVVAYRHMMHSGAGSPGLEALQTLVTLQSASQTLCVCVSAAGMVCVEVNSWAPSSSGCPCCLSCSVVVPVLSQPLLGTHCWVYVDKWVSLANGWQLATTTRACHTPWHVSRDVMLGSHTIWGVTASVFV